MKLKYSTRLNDDLVAIYNAMIQRGLEFTPDNVWNAAWNRLGSGYDKPFCEKFITELDYIKGIIPLQPETAITSRNWRAENNEYGAESTETYKSFDSGKMQTFMWKYQKTGVLITNTVKTNHEYLA